MALHEDGCVASRDGSSCWKHAKAEVHDVNDVFGLYGGVRDGAMAVAWSRTDPMDRYGFLVDGERTA